MAFDMGWNFRSTLAYRTDPAYGVFCATTAYPHTFTNGNGDSINAGWASGSTAGQNLSTTNDVRLAGDVYINDTTSATFQVDLSSGSAPGAGDYTIDMALGTAVAGSRAFTAIFVKDNTTAVIGPSGDIAGVAANQFVDATLTKRTCSGTTDWSTVGVTATKTFASTTAILGFTGKTDYASVAHFRLTLQGGASQSVVPVLIAQYRARG